jgi:hypothetical protein
MEEEEEDEDEGTMFDVLVPVRVLLTMKRKNYGPSDLVDIMNLRSRGDFWTFRFS